jgi:anaphase-promoting complex subunit 3
LCKEALQMFHLLPPQQFASAWVQQHVGKAHFEMADYANALDAFQAMHRSEPHRLEVMLVLVGGGWCWWLVLVVVVGAG